MFVIETRPQRGGCFGVFASSAFRDCLTCWQTRCEQCRGTTAPLRQQHEHCTRCHVDGCVVDGTIESYRHAMVAIVATLSQSQEKSKETLTQKEEETLSQETLSQEGRGAITVDAATRNEDGGELEPEILSQLSQGSSAVDIAVSYVPLTQKKEETLSQETLPAEAVREAPSPSSSIHSNLLPPDSPPNTQATQAMIEAMPDTPPHVPPPSSQPAPAGHAGDGGDAGDGCGGESPNPFARRRPLEAPLEPSSSQPSPAGHVGDGGNAGDGGGAGDGGEGEPPNPFARRRPTSQTRILSWHAGDGGDTEVLEGPIRDFAHLRRGSFRGGSSPQPSPAGPGHAAGGDAGDGGGAGDGGDGEPPNPFARLLCRAGHADGRDC